MTSTRRPAFALRATARQADADGADTLVRTDDQRQPFFPADDNYFSRFELVKNKIYRAGIVKRPEDYRWCSLGYHLQTNDKTDFLSLDFGLREFEPDKNHSGATSDKERLNHYRGFVYAKGGIHGPEERTEQNITTIDRFRSRTRYFADSGIIGSREFVGRLYAVFKGHFSAKHEKKGKAISGLEGVYSLKRLYGEG